MERKWSTTTKLVVVVSLLIVGAWLLIQFSQILPPLVVSLVIALLLKPVTDWLVRNTGWPRGVAVIIVLGIGIALLALTPLLITPSLIAILSNIRFDLSAISALIERLSSQSFQIGPLVISGELIAERVVESLQSLVSPFTASALRMLTSLAASLLWLLFVGVTSFWLLKDSHKLQVWLFDRMPVGYRSDFQELVRRLSAIWGGFFRGELLLGLTVGLIVGGVLWVLGIPYVMLLAFLAGLAEFVPTLGPIIAGALAVIVAWVQGSSWLPLSNSTVAIIVAVFYIFIFQIDQIVLIPRIVGSRVRVHPALVFVGTVIGATQIGILGVLLAAPTIASVLLLGGYIYHRLLDLPPFPELAGESAPVVRGMLGGQQITALLFDLDGTISDTDDVAVEQIVARLGRLRRLFPKGNAQPFVRHLVMMWEGPANWILTQLNRVGLDDEAFQFSQRLRKIYGARSAEQMRLIPGVAAALAQLSETYPLALVTTRGRTETEYFLAIHDLRAYFTVVVSRDDVRRLKPHPESVLRAAEALGVPPAQCAMVGDTSIDMQAARAAGAGAIGVLCGFGTEKDLDDAHIVLPGTADLISRF